MILKTLGSTKFKTWPGEDGVRIGGDRRTECNRNKFNRSKIDGGEFDGGEVGDNGIGKKVQNLFKSKKIIGLDFFTLRANLPFIELRQAFVKAPILHHFDLKRHIRIETNVSSYANDEVYCQLTSDNLGW